jgi:hypothetical protein
MSVKAGQAQIRLRGQSGERPRLGQLASQQTDGDYDVAANDAMTAMNRRLIAGSDDLAPGVISGLHRFRRGA